MVGLNDIRRSFIDFFVRNGHEAVASSSLVPENDPTLLFTNAGMVQFKNLFTGLETRDYTRAVTSQKCVRAGGKHNDLDNVGYTARHHTFFEMLGNFSFGDYFKETAIPLAWELITKDFGISKERLLVTIYHDDDEAADLWKKVAGLPESRIIRIATSDNFWSMGPVGPCGPCSEIFYDHGEHIWGGPPGSAEEDGDRFIEIWNLVFMQFEQQENGERISLPSPSIDTGMGLERIGALLMGKHDNYDTDVMRKLIEASASISGTDPDGPGNVHHRVIADHIRSTAFLISDGVLPGNEGRGYVLRRIMRRAMRHLHMLGVTEPSFHKLSGPFVQEMGEYYTELLAARPVIENTLLQEERRFRTTLERGLSLLTSEMDKLADGGVLPGETAFKLYDTYGFPLDLTQDVLREHGFTVDTAGFDAAMAEQKKKARQVWAGSGDAVADAVWFDLADTLGATEFLGYTRTEVDAVIEALVDADGKVVEALTGPGWAVLNQTPFYAEAGGQVGDKGHIKTDTADIPISNTQIKSGLIAHWVDENPGLQKGQSVRLTVDAPRRAAIAASHSATHLLHEALRRQLGDHVAQRGSLVDADRIRFDISHGQAVGRDEMVAIEQEVNAYIRQNTPVETRVMSLDDAKVEGARALFGERYGDEVRVVSMGSDDAGAYSVELCGGTHVKRTGQIGLLIILSDSASSAGVRRIECLTGASALAHLQGVAAQLLQAANVLKCPVSDVVTRSAALVDERKQLQNSLENLKRAAVLSRDGPAGIAEDKIGPLTFSSCILSGVSAKDLRGLIDEARKDREAAIITLIADTGGKAAIAIGVSEDITGSVSAVDLVRIASEKLGGKGGGGRDDFAQAGGPNPSRASEAFDAIRAYLSKLVEEA